MAGPLSGLRVIEVAAIGPAPFGAMLLADMGAEVIRIDRKSGAHRAAAEGDVLQRGRRSLALDLKHPQAKEIVLRLAETADVLIEGFRPGVMERLGLGPEVCCARNARLVYGRMTGWGQHGPLAEKAGHDINFIALSGALHAMGPADGPPVPPLNLIGDFGGGGMMLAFGLLCAVFEARRSGKGQVVDAAMSDGSNLLMAMLYSYRAKGRWNAERGTNFLDGSAHFYTTYACADGKWIAVGAIEPPFYQAMLEGCGLAHEPAFAEQWNMSQWSNLKAQLAAVFATRTRDQWCEVFAEKDACVTPVLDIDEAPMAAHHRERQAFIELDGVVQPAPAPRFTRSAPATPRPAVKHGADTAAILTELGLSKQEQAQLRNAQVI